MSDTTMRRLLVLSLALNLFIVSAVAGGIAWWAGSAREREPAQAVQRGLRFAAQALPAERQHEFRQALRRARRDAVPLITSAREQRAEVARLLGAPQFDRPAMDAAMRALRDTDQAIRIRIEAVVLDFAQGLGEDERRRFVDGLRNTMTLRQGPAIDMIRQ